MLHEPTAARAIAEPGARSALRRQVRSDVLAVARAAAAIGAEIALLGLVGIPALNSLGLCVAVVLTVIAMIRVRRTVKVFRRVRRSHWRPMASAWTYAEPRERSAAVLLRDPGTGEQAALHVQRLPHAKAMPTDMLLPVWFAGDLTAGGVITPAGGGALMYARPFRTGAARREAIPRTIHEQLTAPVTLPSSQYINPRVRSSIEWELKRERAQARRMYHDRLTAYDSFELDWLRWSGHVPPGPVATDDAGD